MTDREEDDSWLEEEFDTDTMEALAAEEEIFELEGQEVEETQKYISTVIQIFQPVRQSSMDHVYKQIKAHKGTVFAVGDETLVDLTESDIQQLEDGM